MADIVAFDLERKKRKRLTYEGGVQPSWSPTGRKIVYAKPSSSGAQLDGARFLHTVNVKTGKSRQITFSSDYK
jgi:Tol biopolymer transport system component